MTDGSTTTTPDPLLDLWDPPVGSRRWLQRRLFETKCSNCRRMLVEAYNRGAFR